MTRNRLVWPVFSVIWLVLLFSACAPKNLDPRSSSHEWREWVQILDVEGFRFEGDHSETAKWTGLGVVFKDNLLLSHASTVIRAKSIVGRDLSDRSCTYSRLLWVDPELDLAVLYGDDCRHPAPRMLKKPLDSFGLRNVHLFLVSLNSEGTLSVTDDNQVLRLETAEGLEALRITNSSASSSIDSVAFAYANGTFVGLSRGEALPNGQRWLTPVWSAKEAVAAFSPTPVALNSAFSEATENLRSSQYLEQKNICLPPGTKADIPFEMTEAVDVVATVTPQNAEVFYTFSMNCGEQTRFKEIVMGEKQVTFTLDKVPGNRMSVSNSESAKTPFCFDFSLQRVNWSQPPTTSKPVPQQEVLP